MKNLFVAAFVALFIVGCSGSGKMSDAEYRKNMQEFMADQGDFNAMRSLCYGGDGKTPKFGPACLMVASEFFREKDASLTKEKVKHMLELTNFAKEHSKEMFIKKMAESTNDFYLNIKESGRYDKDGIKNALTKTIVKYAKSCDKSKGEEAYDCFITGSLIDTTEKTILRSDSGSFEDNFKSSELGVIRAFKKYEKSMIKVFEEIKDMEYKYAK